MRYAALVLAALAALAGCTHARPIVDCPGQPNLSRTSDAELDRTARGTVPDRDATTLANVRWTVSHRRSYFFRHFTGVAAVRPGRGWGVTSSLDQYGNPTYHRGRDYMVVVTLRTSGACPDTTGGTIFVFGRDASRVPVRFVHWTA